MKGNTDYTTRCINRPYKTGRISNITVEKGQERIKDKQRERERDREKVVDITERHNKK